MLQLLDLAGLYYRAFYGTPTSVTSPTGMPINAVRGSLEIIRRMIEEGQPRRVLACLDLDWRPDFRVDAIPSYKTHRVLEVATAAPGPDGAAAVDVEDEPGELGPQVPVLLEFLAAIGIGTAGAVGHEADDVIGTLAARSETPVEVVTGDRDLYQVATDGPPLVVVRYLGAGIAKMVVLDADAVAVKHGIPVGRYADFAALRGDPSDGLPGVPGVGDKTAAALITAVGGLDDLIAALDDPGAPLTVAQRKKLDGARDYLAVAGTVVRVATDAPILFDAIGDVDLPMAPRDPERLRELAAEYGLTSTVGRFTDTLAAR